MGAVVAGVILDESVELTGSSSLLRKLRHSNLHLAISYPAAISDDKASFLKTMATQYSLDCFMLDASSTDGVLKDVHLAWGDLRGTILYVVSNDKAGSFNQLTNLGWIIVAVGEDAEGAVPCDNSSTLYINKLEELLVTICRFNRKAIGDSIVTVGYIMKPSREEDFAKRGAFPLCPTPNGLLFLPLTFDLPLPTQLQDVDIILHKATDEILSVDLSDSTESSSCITYTAGMQELQRYMQHHPDCFVIDPLDKIYPVLDRLKIQQVLLGLEGLNKKSSHTIRGPHFLKVDNFNESDVVKRLPEANLSLPSIVKPQIACGVADAHSMAIVFRAEDFKDLSVPLPAVVQEYIDHSSTLFKIYVLGERVFYAVKKSIPNVDMLMKLSENKGVGPLLFDSLKSLPTTKEQSSSGDLLTASCFDLDLVTEAAHWLAHKLDLTIFGFDVVIKEGTTDHVIVDVNYLPSFKEVPNDICIPAFWEAIKQKFESRDKNPEALIPFG
ncbi:inositol 1 3 4-trisphosphate 5/6-kinase 4 [Euphorbia peplus]|nr:inositol 1 3 4-trisphosphate 5/6-kinase 4 [Euphorbia peplus]